MTLNISAIQSLQETELLFIFYAFSNDIHVQVAAHLDDSANQCRVIGAVRHVADKRLVDLQSADRKLLDKAMTKLGLSARGYYKILKVARTIADIENSEEIETHHLSEALGYRRLDRYQTPTY